MVPKDPYERFQDIPADAAASLTATLCELTPAIEAAVGADASTIVLTNGSAAGQEIPHVHWHVVPRFADDGTLFGYRSLPDEAFDESKMESVAAGIRDEL